MLLLLAVSPIDLLSPVCAGIPVRRELMPDVQFTDITAASGVDFKQENSATGDKYLIESMGGGVALLDYDNDGRLDVFFTNGAKLDDQMPEGKEPDKSDKRFFNRLYHGNGDGTFSDVTEKAGLTGSPKAGYGMGVAIADYDNDGFADIYLTNYGANILYHNNGNGTFTDVTSRAGVVASGWSTSAGFFDYNNDGKLDLFVCRYLDWTFQKNIYCGERRPGYRAYCHPDNFKGITNILYRNNGNGTFTDVSKEAGIANPAGKGLGVAFADYDNDGWVDVYVANDSVQCFLYHNNRNGTFTDVSLTAGVGYNEDGKVFAGMGTDFSDYDNDGLPDILVTDLSNEMYALYHNTGDGTFTYDTNKSGVGRATLLYSGWGTKFIDYDGDGWRDIFVAQGHVLDTIELTSNHLKYLQPPLLLKNSNGRFTNASEQAGKAFTYPWAGRGAAFGDIDNDGDIDIAVSNCGQKAYILRNDGGNRNNWLSLKMVGAKSNRDGIGCRVKIVTGAGLTQSYMVNTSSSYLSASDKRLTVGLGQEQAAKLIEIRWPSGIVQTLKDVKSNQMLTLKEPER